MSKDFCKGLRCERCGGPRHNLSRRWCLDCFNLSRVYLEQRQPHRTGVTPVISPWQDLPNGDRVRTIKG